MAEVLYVSPEHTFQIPHAIQASKTRHLTAFAPLVRTLFQRGNDEHDIASATVVVLRPEAQSAKSSPAHSELDTLSFDDRVLLLRYFFSHMNIVVVSAEEVADAAVVRELNSAIAQIEVLVHTRISRVATWTGTGVNINDAYGEKGAKSAKEAPSTKAEAEAREHHLQISDIVATMSFLVHRHANVSGASLAHVTALKDAVLRSVDFLSLMHDHSPARLRTLCHAVGHWGFPAHELSNDDLVYCVYLMVGFALEHVRRTGLPESLHVPSPNELLALVFMVRDTYKSGNSFHNFRHAVDVLQACFHFLIRLRCLPRFEQLELDPQGDEGRLFAGDFPTVACTELVVSEDPASPVSENALLRPIQTLGLVVAALGHDVGHPGVTNAFMIKHHSPTSQLFGERAVLESYHASVFVNKILSVNWPGLLVVNGCAAGGNELPLKGLIINSILATDMAEHFEYVSRLENLDLASPEPSMDRVRLICSLLIKCADISNVTRPLRISAQWASVLSQEFSEVETLEKAIRENASQYDDVSYSKLPSTVEAILEAYPAIHKGQIFFIQTFAAGLFKSMVKHFPELQFTTDIIDANNQFWLARVEQLKTA